MPDRFIFSLRFSTKVFLKLFYAAASLIFFMTLFRINLFFLVVFSSSAEANALAILESFWTGFRFDLLVFGFLFIPIYFVVVGQGILIKWPQWMFSFYRVYFIGFWLWICGLTFFDFYYFAEFGVRMRFEAYSNFSLDNFFKQFLRLQANQSWIFLVVTLLLVVLGTSMTKSIKFGQWKDEFSPRKAWKFESVIRILVPLLLIAFTARGTLEEHHLRFEHSQISDIKALNEMALNAVWCFDK